VDSETATESRLRCIECRQLSEVGAHGWRAYVVFLEEDRDPPEVVVYCPGCAEYELGD